MPGLKTYAGKDISITFDLKRCIHAEECGKRLPAVFDAHHRPWVDPDGAGVDTIAEVVSHCPSGALHAQRADGVEAESSESPAEIVVGDHGPLYLRGNIEIVATDGSLIGRETRVALCRCGLSENKPFCDNSHIGQFEASGPLGRTKVQSADPGESEVLSIAARKDGPYILKGSFVIRAGNGGEQIAGMKGALCRCGHSNNKPFCDGTHREVGFEAE